MGYSFQTFTFEQILTSAQMNQVEQNVRDHFHGRANVSKIGVSFPVVSKSSAFAATVEDIGQLFSCTGTFTLTLPDSAQVGAGYSIAVMNMGSGTITLQPSGSNTIGGTTNYSMGLNECVVITTDGAGAYYLIGAGGHVPTNLSVFTTVGTTVWTVPGGVTSCLVSLLGGTGGGAGGTYVGAGGAGGTGGASSFDTLTTGTAGGGLASGAGGAAPAVWSGSPGIVFGRGAAGGSATTTSVDYYYKYYPGAGGASGLNLSYGGAGGSGPNYDYQAGGGGAGANFISEIFTGLTPGTNINIVVGAKGLGGARGGCAGSYCATAGSDGEDGKVIVRW